MSQLPLTRSTISILAVGLLCCLSIFALILRSEVAVRDGSRKAEGHGYSIPRHVQYGLTLRNETNRLVEAAELWAHAPVKVTATQRCERLEVSHPHELVVDEAGNQILHFTFKDIPPYATKIINIQADLMLSERPNPVPVQNLASMLKPEGFIESDDPAVYGFAKMLKASVPSQTAENIYRWVSANVRNAGYLPEDRGALYALLNRQGDCSEFAYLFIACCRANGIPARVISGYTCNDDCLLRPGGYHAWAEFHSEGTWQIADPQRQVFRGDSSRYVAMQVGNEPTGAAMDAHQRFHCIGEGIVVRTEQ